jgi:hypothetical protein
MADFKARIRREVPKEGETRVVFSIRTARGTRMELEGTFNEETVLKAWQELHADLSKRGGAAKL